MTIKELMDKIAEIKHIRSKQDLTVEQKQWLLYLENIELEEPKRDEE